VVPTEPECQAAVDTTQRLLEELGHRVEPSLPDGLKSDEIIGHFTACFGAWTAADLDQMEATVGVPIEPGDFEPPTMAIAELGRVVTASQYLAALDTLHAWSRTVCNWWEDFDVLVTPTIPVLPTPLGAFDSPPDSPLDGLAMSSTVVLYTAPFNITGQPAISLPMHWSAAGLPVGVQLIAAYGREDVLFQVAAQLEAAAPWADRTPPIWSGS
jgi:amidase